MENCCKYCNTALVDILNEGLQCESCAHYVHLSCLKRGSTPGAFAGDVFFRFTCLECSATEQEVFTRDNPRWFHILILAFYHINVNNKALSRKGYYHWRIHIGSFVDKNWNALFDKTFKQKKNWMGTISGLLSVNSTTFFTRCLTPAEAGWWALTYPKLTPNVIAKLANELSALKLTLKSQNETKSDAVLLAQIIEAKNYPDEYTIINRSTDTSVCELDIKQENGETNENDEFIIEEYPQPSLPEQKLTKSNKQKRSLLPNFEYVDTEMNTPPRKKQKFNSEISSFSSWDETPTSSSQESSDSKDGIIKIDKPVNKQNTDCESAVKLLDPMCHYNTSLLNLFMLKRLNLKTKITGGLREEPILSPYSNLYLKPYIHRDVKRTPHWLKIMTQIQLKVNETVKDYVLPCRSTIDYVYVQPAHIPAINSLCNQFFWPGIDLTECLQYPDFSCVVMYKKLIIGFAFIVPDVKVHENYISFIFVRPGWRNIGIGRFMVYHLIQTCMGKDITLHVAINNPALFLYQKFGFKVEHVELNFYEKYLRNDSFESKHAFFCRLER